MRNTIFHNSGVKGNQLLLVSFLILIVLNYFGNYILYSSIIVIPIWALWIAYVLGGKFHLSKNEGIFIKSSIAFLLIVFVYRLIGYSSIETLGLIGILNWIMSGVVAIYAMKVFSGRDLSTIYIVMIISLFLLMLLFAREGSTILRAGDESEAVEVADAWYGSLFVLLSGLSLIVFLHVKRLFPRILSILIIVITTYINIFILQRGTNVIMTIVEIGMILLFLIKRKSVVISISIILVGFLFFAFSSENLIVILDWLAEISPSDRVSDRFSQISMAIVYEDMTVSQGSLAGRGELMTLSWNTFTSSFNHILFGAGEHAGDNTIIGHHSFILDTLACYGLVGGSLLFIYFKKQYQILMSYLDRDKEWTLYMQCAIVFLFYVFRNFYGQVAYALVNLVLLLFFPLTYKLINYYKNSN